MSPMVGPPVKPTYIGEPAEDFARPERSDGLGVGGLPSLADTLRLPSKSRREPVAPSYEGRPSERRCFSGAEAHAAVRAANCTPAADQGSCRINALRLRETSSSHRVSAVRSSSWSKRIIQSQGNPRGKCWTSLRRASERKT